MAGWTVKENEQGGQRLEHDEVADGILFTPAEHDRLRGSKTRAEFREELSTILNRGNAPEATSDDEDAIREAVGGQPFKVAKKVERKYKGGG